MMMGTEWNLLMGTDWMALQKAWHCTCWSVLLMAQQMMSQMDAPMDELSVLLKELSTAIGLDEALDARCDEQLDF
jgi:hypothetical protein